MSNHGVFFFCPWSLTRFPSVVWIFPPSPFLVMRVLMGMGVIIRFVSQPHDIRIVRMEREKSRGTKRERKRREKKESLTSKLDNKLGK